MTLAKVKEAQRDLERVKGAQRVLERAAEDHRLARKNLRIQVHAARKRHTLQEIGDALGMTRQSVYDLLKR